MRTFPLLTGDRGVLLGIYLNDHLAGATAGLELFRRATGTARGRTGQVLTQLTAEVEQDRQSLLHLMGQLDVPVRHYKVFGGWALEKVGRLKVNGSLVRRSPLSDLIELEALVLAVQGKAAGFRTLRRVAEVDPRLAAAELDRLLDRAGRQAQMLEQLRVQTSVRVLAPVSFPIGASPSGASPGGASPGDGAPVDGAPVEASPVGASER